MANQPVDSRAVQAAERTHLKRLLKWVIVCVCVFVCVCVLSICIHYNYVKIAVKYSTVQFFVCDTTYEKPDTQSRNKRVTFFVNCFFFLRVCLCVCVCV